MKFPDPPTASNFLPPDSPPGQSKADPPTFPWESWFQAISNSLTSPQLKRYTPPTSTSAGVQDSVTYDANFLYICVGTNQWKRVSLSAF